MAACFFTKKGDLYRPLHPQVTLPFLTKTSAFERRLKHKIKKKVVDCGFIVHHKFNYFTESLNLSILIV